MSVLFEWRVEAHTEANPAENEVEFFAFDASFLAAGSHISNPSVHLVFGELFTNQFSAHRTFFCALMRCLQL